MPPPPQRSAEGYTTAEQMLYLHLAAVVRYDEAEQDDGGEADHCLEGQGVDRALWVGSGVGGGGVKGGVKKRRKEKPNRAEFVGASRWGGSPAAKTQTVILGNLMRIFSNPCALIRNDCEGQRAVIRPPLSLEIGRAHV